MADPVFVDDVTPLNAGNMNKLQTRDEKAATNGYASLGADGKVPAAQLPVVPPLAGLILPALTTLSAGENDVPWGGGSLIQALQYFAQATAGVAIRRLGAPSVSGTTISIYATGLASPNPLTLRHNAATGTGAVFWFANQQDLVLAPDEIATFTYDEGYWYVLSVTRVAGNGVLYGTSLPASPQNGQEAILVDSLTAPTYQWRFRYNASRADANKWEFIGGAPASAIVATAEATTSTSYVALTTPGPSITVPRAGIYDVRIGCDVNAIDQSGSYMSYDLGATAANDAWSICAPPRNTGQWHSMFGSRRQTVAVAAALVAKYRQASIGPSFRQRLMEVTPVAVA